MSRAAKGARLYWRASKNVWIVRDTGCPDQSTGTSDRGAAERALAAYIGKKGTIAETSRADLMPVADVLAIYGSEHGAGVAAPERLGYAISALLPFWGALMVGDVKGETCRRYARTRIKANGDPVSSGTIRRELNTMQAAINYAHAEGYLLTPAKVTLPPPPPPRDRWLTRDEAAALLWAAWRSSKGQHIARFILVSLYTGTRKDAVCRLGFIPSVSSGWVDVDQGVMNRAGAGERETNKRRGRVRLTRRLLSHCRRWRANGASWVVEAEGARVGDIRKAFAGAVQRAGLEGVTPHTLKHTAITWAIQRGMTDHDAADYFSTSVETIRETYYHHSPDYHSRALRILDAKLVPAPN
jgi:integrase